MPTRNSRLPGRRVVLSSVFGALAAIFCLGNSVVANADPTTVVYNGTLQNGWQDWSYTTHNLANPSPIHSGSKSIATTFAPWKALYFHHDPVPIASYSAIKFWVNGGKTGGQRFQVAALDPKGSGPSTPSTKYLPGGAIPAKKWTLVTIPISDLKIADMAHFTGFWIQDDTGKPQPTFYVDAITLVNKPGH